MHQEDIASSIRERFNALKEQRKAALATADDILEEMKRLRAAFRALSGESPDPEVEAMVAEAEKDSAARKKPRSGKPTMKPEDVRSCLYEVLLFGPLDGKEVQRRVGEIVTGRGLSRKGLHFTIARELRKLPDFEEAEGKWNVRTRETGIDALVHRVRSILEDGGPMAEPRIRERVGELHTDANGNLEKYLTRALRQGPFEFNGAKWGVAEATS